MRALLKRQSELSAASAAFYFLGGVISVLALTAYYDAANPLNTASMAIGFMAFLVSGVFLYLGNRAEPAPALLLMAFTGSIVLILVAFSRFETRAMGTGLLFYTFFIYFAWFGKMWVARIVGYSWLLTYCALMVMHFGVDVSQYLTTLVLTAVILGELIGTYKRRLERTSVTDALCGTWNKRGFNQVMERTVQIVRRTGEPLSVLFFDLDDFKSINDQQGHRQGDRVLQAFASQLEANTRPQDTLARYGGDEFVLVLPGTDAFQAEAMAARLEHSVTAAEWSCGWAELLAGESTDELIERADLMLLEHKRQRKSAESNRPHAPARVD